MPKINILSKHTADLIAAGEVVERPASAVKELVENSIDAGATSVTVEIQNGGISYIRITDNGCGIAREDIKNAFLPHATSKISDENDLNSILTLGFRGEALASISAVSRVDILTKTSEEQFGTRYVIEGGTEKLLDDAGCPNGTTVVVRNLFFNTPARMKFLKKNISEANAVADVLDRMALSHPEISFRFIREGKETLSSPGDGKLISAIYSVYGKEFASGLIPVDYENDMVKVGGFVSKPMAARKSRSMQLFFLNGRFVKTGTAAAALNEAYRNSIMVGKFPACVLHIDFPPNAVDVNVHPAKLEVRFTNEKPVFDAVYYGVKNALAKGDTRPEARLSEPKSSAAFSRPQSLYKKSNMFAQQKFLLSKRPAEADTAVLNKPCVEQKDQQISREITPVLKQTQTFYNRPIETNRSVDVFKDEAHDERANASPTFPAESSLEGENLQKNRHPIQDMASFVKIADDDRYESPLFVGEAFATYVIIEVGKKLLLIDKHAAHERILFNKLCENHNSPSAQMLLEPVTVTLRKTEYTVILDNLELLKNAGIIAEDFGMGSIVVRSVPMNLDGESIPDLIEELAERLSKTPGVVSTEKQEWIYHSIACRAAVKAGDKSDKAELMALAEQIIKDDSIRYCPHGRPVAVWLSKYELEKQFGRV